VLGGVVVIDDLSRRTAPSVDDKGMSFLPRGSSNERATRQRRVSWRCGPEQGLLRRSECPFHGTSQPPHACETLAGSGATGNSVICPTDDAPQNLLSAESAFLWHGSPKRRHAPPFTQSEAVACSCAHEEEHRKWTVSHPRRLRLAGRLLAVRAYSGDYISHVPVIDGAKLS
jgi:hypothetical protein